MRFTIRGVDNQTYTADLTTLQAWARDGRITPVTMIIDDTQGSQWIPASSVAELAGYFAPPVAAASSAGRKNLGCGAAVAMGLLAVMFLMFGMQMVAILCGLGAVIALVVAMVSPSGNSPRVVHAGGGGNSNLIILAVVGLFVLVLGACYLFINSPSRRTRETPVAATTEPTGTTVAEEEPRVSVASQSVPLPSQSTTTAEAPPLAVVVTAPPAIVITTKRNENATTSTKSPQHEYVYGVNDSGLYYREDCERPARATKMMKSAAIMSGLRPAPQCYGR